MEIWPLSLRISLLSSLLTLKRERSRLTRETLKICRRRPPKEEKLLTSTSRSRWFRRERKLLRRR